MSLNAIDRVAFMIEDLLGRYFHELSELRASSLLLIEFALAAAVLGIARQPSSSRGARLTAAIGFLGCLAVWALLAWRERWVCDDAFVSFRYARNWIEGKGLVYNPGEHVEGYTNFLWTALVALGLVLHIDPVLSSVALGFASALAALLLCWKLSRDLSPGQGIVLLAPSVVLLAGNRLFAQYTTSGLETMFAATLSLFALERAIHGRRMAAGFAGVLATMAHPDHALAYAALFFALCLDPAVRRGNLKKASAFLWPYLVPFFALYLPYFAAKALYYGSWFPNTYYAKSASDAYFSQGLTYLAVSGAAAGLIGALPLAAASVIVLRDQLIGRYVALLAVLYLGYVAKIGGDFMMGRLLVLLMLPLAVLLDAGARALFARGGLQRGAAVVGCAAAATLLVHASVIKVREKYQHLADEQTFYELKTLTADGVASGLTDLAHQFQIALASAKVKPTLVTGCVGIFGYLTGLHIVDAYGLTDAHVARQPLAQRGRPGHEKRATLAYALSSGGDLADYALWPGGYERYTATRVGSHDLSLLAHRPAVITGLKRGPNVRLPDTEGLIRQYKPSPAAGQFACDMWFFDTLYFQHHPPEEKQAFVQRMVAERRIDPALQEFESLNVGEHPLGYTLERSFELDAPEREGFRGTQGTIAAWTTDRERLSQAEVGNGRGRFIDSFTDNEHDATVGEIWSPKFVIQGDVIELYVAGGSEDRHVHVALEIDGREVARGNGCNTELLGRRLWLVTQYKGQRARIRVSDQSHAGWGHVIIDRISEWRADPSRATATSRW
jgi:arabinofuranosyltransferase